MTKNDIADALEEIGTLLDLKGENPFKVRAYQAGARALEAIEEGDLARLIRDGGIEGVKGIGGALAKKIAELHGTGRLRFLEELRASVAPGLVEMLEIPGLGPKKIRALHDKLGISDIPALAAACAAGKVAALDGFGAKSQEKILAGIRNREAYGRRHLWWDAALVARPILGGLRALPDVVRAEAAGSLRRGLETIGDLDFLVSAANPAPVVEWFVSQPHVKEVTAKGETKASIRFESGLQADLRLVPDAQFVFALHHFTGSKDHNVQMRQRALARGLSLSEWGLVPEAAREDRGGTEQGAGEPPEGAKPVRKTVKAVVESLKGAGSSPLPPAPSRFPPPIRNESDLFAALGLKFIPPELREGLGEIEAAEAGALPRLVELADIRGAFHNHTTASDGRSTLTEMVAAADALGWEYIGISDHSKASFQARGLTEERLAKQVAEIHALNASRRFKVHVFTGSEVDILADGRLDFDDSVLATLDCVVASVHNAFAQDEATMTKRIVRALENGRVTMLGHLTGRLLLRRDAYPVDAGKVIDAAIANGVIIELNATPHRLDMDWRHWRRAAARGLLCSVNPDAHATDHLAYVAAGINAARKGWLMKEQVLNTRPLAEVKKYLAR